MTQDEELDRIKAIKAWPENAANLPKLLVKQQLHDAERYSLDQFVHHGDIAATALALSIHKLKEIVGV